MQLKLLAFTDHGLTLAQNIACQIQECYADSVTAERCLSGGLHSWTENAFQTADAILFVGAAGIAVRAIAPFVAHKAKDPAVLVMDEAGRFVIPILSGHLGGANALAQKLSELTGSIPVITTATDINGVFAVDLWAKQHGCVIPNPACIRLVSGALLQGRKIRVYSEFPIAGAFPSGLEAGSEQNCSLAVTFRTFRENVLQCVPRCLVLGIGCRKEISQQQLEEQFQAFLQENQLQECAVSKVCSIDRKAMEPGLLAFCQAHNWILETFSAEQLQGVPGYFSGSEFVNNTVGVDNVCERSAVLGSGGNLLIRKRAGGGVTLAAAIADPELDWGTSE